MDNVDEDEESDPEELVEDSALDEVEGDDEDPAKRKRKRRKRPRYTAVQYKGQVCYCKRKIFGKGDEPEEDEDEFENDALLDEVLSDAEDSPSEEVEEASSDPKKKKKPGRRRKPKRKRRISKRLFFKRLLKSFYRRHLKRINLTCYCPKNKRVAR